MGDQPSKAELEREALAQVDTWEEFVILGVCTSVALAVLWVLFRVESAPKLTLDYCLNYKQPDGETVLFAGSWNPPHEGHMDILRALVGRHGKVVAWVGENRAKKYTATAAQRAALVRAVVDADPKLRGKVEVVLAEPHTYWSSDFVWRTMYKRGIDIMYRGIRSWDRDWPAETFNHVMNLAGPKLFGPLQRSPYTRYVLAGEDRCDLSSTKIRALVADGQSLAGLVPRAIQADVRDLYASKGDKAA